MKYLFRALRPNFYKRKNVTSVDKVTNDLDYRVTQKSDNKAEKQNISGFCLNLIENQFFLVATCAVLQEYGFRPLSLFIIKYNVLYM